MASLKQSQNRVTQHELFLDELCASGTCNMFAAIPYLRKEFPDLTQWDAIDILGYWMATYNKRKGDDKYDPIFD